MFGLIRRYPVDELTSLQSRMNQVMNEVLSDFDEPSPLSASSFIPRTDIYEENDRLSLEMEVPGLRPDDFTLTVEGNTLTVSGERKAEADREKGRYHRLERAYGSFTRSFTLPSSVDAGSVKANYESGVLHLTMMKRAEAQPRQIKVTGEKDQLTAKAA